MSADLTLQPSMLPGGDHGRFHSFAATAAYPHTMQIYDDDRLLVDDVSRWVGAALGAGDAVVILATPDHRDGIARGLEERGLDLPSIVAQGRFITRDAATVLGTCQTEDGPDGPCFADLITDLVREAGASADGAPRRVAVYGELVALLVADGQYAAALELEAIWNDLIEALGFTLHCSYPLSAFPREADGEHLNAICGTHTGVTPLASFMMLDQEDDRLRAVALLQQKAQTVSLEIAERKRIDQELIERNRELRSAVAARDVFLAVAAHELKTPVTSLRGYTQLLQRAVQRGAGLTPDRLARSLDAIEVQTGKISQLVARLLDTAQIKSGRLQIEPVPVDLAALVQAAISHQPVPDNLVLVYEGPESLVATLDPVRIEQVIVNLIDNAVKYSPNGGRVTVGVRERAGGIEIAVTDQGIGIPAEQREAVFHLFHQADAENHLSGMGLGLYISRQIIELHGGSMRIEEPGHQGTRVVVWVPAETGTPVPAVFEA